MLTSKIELQIKVLRMFAKRRVLTVHSFHDFYSITSVMAVMCLSDYVINKYKTYFSMLSCLLFFTVSVKLRLSLYFFIVSRLKLLITVLLCSKPKPRVIVYRVKFGRVFYWTFCTFKLTIDWAVSQMKCLIVIN